METTEGSLWTARSGRLPDRVFWEIDDLQTRLQQSNILRSDAFSFGGQRWRLLLLTDSTHLSASLSRVDNPDEPPLFPVVWWHAGVVDIDGTWHYDRRGCVRPYAPFRGWKTAAEWVGPVWNDLFLKKDEFLPGGRMTLACQLRGCLELQGTSAVDFSPENSAIPFNVTVTVRDRAFHMEMPILEALSPVLAAMLYSSSENSGDQGLRLDHCDPWTFEVALSFLYTGSLDDIDTETLFAVYHVADEYDVPGLKEECVRLLLGGLTARSVGIVLALAEREGDEELRERATLAAWLQLEIVDAELADEVVTASQGRED